jgi:integrase
MKKSIGRKRRNDVYVFKRDDSAYYLCSYRVKVRDPERGIRTIQRTLSTQTADDKVAQKRANRMREEDVARFYDNEQGTRVNLRDDYPTCGQIVDLYLAVARNKSTKNVARDFLTVVAEGTMILGDKAGREKARSIKASELTTDHMLRWRNQEARIKAGLEPRTPANVNYFMRAAKSVFSNQNTTETYNGLKLPPSIDLWRKISFLKAPKNGGFQQIPQAVLARMDRRARKFFLRIARWYQRHKNERFVNQYLNAHACYWLIRRCGLRNSEVEQLRWEWFKKDEEGKIWLHLVHYPYWEPKGSPGKIPVAQDLYHELVSIFGPPRSGPDGFVLLGTKDHRDDGSHRAPSKFCRKYVRGDRDKSLYELRKQYGSEIALRYGIEMAAKLLRHADIHTTWKHYMDLLKLREVQPL